MKTLKSDIGIKVPKDVKVTIKSRLVEVSEKLGALKRNFRHLPGDLKLIEGGKKIKVGMWFGLSKQQAALRTCCSHTQNCFEGVTKRFQHKLRLVYAHFPINATGVYIGRTLELRNFLGEQIVRVVRMLDGVTVDKSQGEGGYSSGGCGP